VVVELVQCLYAAVAEARFCSAALEVVSRDLSSVLLSIAPAIYFVGF